MRAFDVRALADAIPEERKALVRARVLAADPNRVFYTAFVGALLGIPADEDGLEERSAQTARLAGRGCSVVQARALPMPCASSVSDLFLSVVVLCSFFMCSVLRSLLRVGPVAFAGATLVLLPGLMRF